MKIPESMGLGILALGFAALFKEEIKAQLAKIDLSKGVIVPTPTQPPVIMTNGIPKIPPPVVPPPVVPPPVTPPPTDQPGISIWPRIPWTEISIPEIPRYTEIPEGYPYVQQETGFITPVPTIGDEPVVPHGIYTFYPPGEGP